MEGSGWAVKVVVVAASVVAVLFLVLARALYDGLRK